MATKHEQAEADGALRFRLARCLKGSGLQAVQVDGGLYSDDALVAAVHALVRAVLTPQPVYVPEGGDDRADRVEAAIATLDRRAAAAAAEVARLRASMESMRIMAAALAQRDDAHSGRLTELTMRVQTLGDTR